MFCFLLGCDSLFDNVGIESDILRRATISSATKRCCIRTKSTYTIGQLVYVPPSHAIVLLVTSRSSRRWSRSSCQRIRLGKAGSGSRFPNRSFPCCPWRRSSSRKQSGAARQPLRRRTCCEAVHLQRVRRLYVREPSTFGTFGIAKTARKLSVRNDPGRAVEDGRTQSSVMIALLRGTTTLSYVTRGPSGMRLILP